MPAESKTPLLMAKLVALAAAMFMFAIFVLPPLYDLFCEITGIGGKTDGAYTAVAVEVDTSRDIEVQFVATNNATMPWDFYPVEERVVVHPGEAREVVFTRTIEPVKTCWVRQYPMCCPTMLRTTSTKPNVSALTTSPWLLARAPSWRWCLS